MNPFTSSGAGTTYPSGAPAFTPGFQWGSCYSTFSFICRFCRSLCVFLSFFFWPLCYLLFFDIQILIAPLVSSNSSWRYKMDNQNAQIDYGQTSQWPKRAKRQRTTDKTKDRVARSPLSTTGELRSFLSAFLVLIGLFICLFSFQFYWGSFL